MKPPFQVNPLVYVFSLCLLAKIDAVIYSGAKDSNSGNLGPNFTIQKVSLTQKGYIQFLKYATQVPTLRDYTFCIWMRSSNLTYNHPLLSYSKNEDQRLIRVWISEKGVDICLEILEHFIFKIEVNLRENIWYHMCQSWSGYQGAWDLYLNGKHKSSGFVPKLRGVSIEGGGDIVVGQEYTDFDKGLDDGIEGDVFGFNMVLSSTSGNHLSDPVKLASHPYRRQSTAVANVYQPPKTIESGLIDGEVFPVNPGHFQGHFSRTRRSRSIFKNMLDLFDAELRSSHAHNKFYTRIPVGNPLIKRITSNDISYDRSTSLGMLLVELGTDCAYKKGAPVSGKGVLISWTKTPVRVFGGAILKHGLPFCRTF